MLFPYPGFETKFNLPLILCCLLFMAAVMLVFRQLGFLQNTNVLFYICKSAALGFLFFLAYWIVLTRIFKLDFYYYVTSLLSYTLKSVESILLWP